MFDAANFELHRQWKESFIVPVYKKDYKTDRCNYRNISLLSNSFEIWNNIILSKLTPYEDEITGLHQCEFRNKGNSASHTHELHASL
jgi:hypothetical protein